MLGLLKKDVDPEEFFIRNYDRMIGWALQLTGGDRPAAEDLLHDVYILFTLRRPESNEIRDVDGYLYTMLRNLRLSQVRRAALAPMQQLSVIEYDSADAGLRTLSQYDIAQAQDDLRRVCLHACGRKERSKAACVLILRFFHGYYPSEVARVLQTTRAAVDVRLREARAEARLVLDSPRARAAGEAAGVGVAFPARFARPTDDFLQELRLMIFRSGRGECLPAARLGEFYRGDGKASPTQEQFAHVVSCRGCLDHVNKLLGIPSLSERDPVDFSDRDPGQKGGGGGGTGLTARKLKRWRRDAQEVFEHKPQELRVSVDGNVRGTQRVNSKLNELNLFIDWADSPNFVEVFSDQGVRLLMLPLTAPPEGTGEQGEQVPLSDGRLLEVAVSFRSPGPRLRCLYRDPAFSAAGETSVEAEESPVRPAFGASGEGTRTGTRAPGGRIRGPLAALWRRVLERRLLLIPAAVTAVVILVAALLLMRSPTTHVSPSELLSRSAAVEEREPGTDSVVHRTLELEERLVPDGGLVARRRVEVWRNAKGGITVRRLFDQRGRLLAGEWRGADGSRTVYRAAEPAHNSARPDGEPAPWGDDSAWQVEPSARDFSALVGHADALTVAAGNDSYLLTYNVAQAQASQEVVAASLVLRRDSLRATGQTLVLRRGGQQRSLSFTETGYERRPADSVPPSVFKPDAELLKSPALHIQSLPAEAPTQSSGPAQTPASEAAPPATAALEMQVLGLLNKAGADLGEQVGVTRTPQGALRVQALVETERRKAELLEALRPVADNPAVWVEVLTAAEAARQKGQGRTTTPTVVQQVEPTGETVAADSDLRRYFSTRGAEGGTKLESDIIRFAVGASAHSRQALQHAWALKRLAGRFAPGELRSLDGDAKATWLAMIRDHAGAVGRETAALDRELEPVFTSQGVGGRAAAGLPSTIDDEAGLAAAAERLLSLCSELDPAVRSAFTASADPSASSAVKSAAFWRGLREAEALAQLIQRSAGRLMPHPGVRPGGAPSPSAAPTPGPAGAQPRPGGEYE